MDAEPGASMADDDRGIRLVERVRRMNIRRVVGAGSIAALAVFVTPAVASPCYVVFDKPGNVIYQSTHPPVDMSVQGAAARNAMRRRGEFIEYFESNQCTERSAGSKSGKGEASVDEIVAGIKPYQQVGRVGAMSNPDDDAGQFAIPSSNSLTAPPSY
jgi:hypothetical protein